MARNGYPENFSDLFQQIMEAGHSMAGAANDFLTSPDPNEPQILDRGISNANNMFDYMGIPQLPGMPRTQQGGMNVLDNPDSPQLTPQQMIQSIIGGQGQSSSLGTVSPVEPGVSMSEAEKANAKVAEAHTAALMKIAAREEANKALIDKRLESLKAVSGPDVLSFVQGKFNPNDKIETGRGGFSKTQGQDESSRSVDSMTKAGFTPQLANILQNLATSKGGADTQAALLAAQMLPQKLNPQQEDLQFLEKALQSKNPAALAIYKVMLRRKGYDEATINQIFNGTQS